MYFTGGGERRRCDHGTTTGWSAKQFHEPTAYFRHASTSHESIGHRRWEHKFEQWCWKSYLHNWYYEYLNINARYILQVAMFSHSVLAFFSFFAFCFLISTLPAKRVVAYNLIFYEISLWFTVQSPCNFARTFYIAANLLAACELWIYVLDILLICKNCRLLFT